MALLLILTSLCGKCRLFQDLETLFVFLLPIIGSFSYIKVVLFVR